MRVVGIGVNRRWKRGGVRVSPTVRLRNFAWTFLGVCRHPNTCTSMSAFEVSPLETTRMCAVPGHASAAAITYSFKLHGRKSADGPSTFLCPDAAPAGLLRRALMQPFLHCLRHFGIFLRHCGSLIGVQGPSFLGRITAGFFKVGLSHVLSSSTSRLT